jgi:hypothetical protein
VSARPTHRRPFPLIRTDDPHADHTPTELEIKVHRADELFQDGALISCLRCTPLFTRPHSVKSTGEATLDSSFLFKTTTINSRKARALKFGTGAFSVDDFVTRLVSYMGGFKPPEDPASEPDDDDVEQDGGDDEPLDWDRIGRRAMAKSRRVPAMGFMCVLHLNLFQVCSWAPGSGLYRCPRNNARQTNAAKSWRRTRTTGRDHKRSPRRTSSGRRTRRPRTSLWSVFPPLALP